LDQSKYLRGILEKYGMTDSKPSSLPMDPGFLARKVRHKGNIA
jgi:hypothetical protein